MLFRVVVVACCVVRIYSLGDGKAFGEKIIILRIKTSSSLFISLSFSLSFSPTTTTTERERERRKREEENDLVVSLFCGGGLK